MTNISTKIYLFNKLKKKKNKLISVEKPLYINVIKPQFKYYFVKLKYKLIV